MSDFKGLPKYKCKKIVGAGKIVAVHNQCIELVHPTSDNKEQHRSLGVTSEWSEKRKPEVGGYLVIYDDGYTSYSPAAAFEAGYDLIGE